MTVKNYVLDINKTSLQHPSIVLRQDDYNIYTVNISVTENGVPVNLGSYTLNFLGITPAGAKIIDSKNFITTPADLAVGKFSYRFPKEAAGSKGIYDVAYFRLKTTSGATSTIDLNLRVLGGIDLTADEVKDYITVDDTLRNTLVAEVFKKVDAKVDEHLATVKKGDKGDTGTYQVNQLFNTEFNNNLEGWKQGQYAPFVVDSTYNGSVRLRNTATIDGNRLYSGLIPVQGVLEISTSVYNNSWSFVRGYDQNKKLIGELKANFVSGQNLNVMNGISIPSTVYYIDFGMQSIPNGYVSQPMLVFASTVETYVQGNYYPVDTIKNTPKLNGNNMYVGDNTYMGTSTFMDGVTLNGKNVVNGLTDTDWLDIPLVAGRTGTAKYKVSLGKVFVHIEGVTGITSTGNNAQGQIGTLPIGPNSYYIGAFCEGSGTIRKINVSNKGVIYISNALGNTLSASDSYYSDFIVI